jgi:hypothetical protein
MVRCRAVYVRVHRKEKQGLRIFYGPLGREDRRPLVGEYIETLNSVWLGFLVFFFSLQDLSGRKHPATHRFQSRVSLYLSKHIVHSYIYYQFSRGCWSMASEVSRRP